MAGRLGVGLTFLALLLAYGPARGSDGVYQEIAVDSDCVIDTPRPDLTLRVVNPTGSQFLAQAEEIQLELLSSVALRGEVAIAVTVFSESGLVTQDPLLEVEVEPLARRSVAVPMARLALPTGPLDFSGRIWFTATATFRDRSRGYLQSPLELYFHPVAGGWMIYDRDTRDTAFAMGALSPEATGLAERGAVDGAELGPAIVEKVSDDTDWRPELDGPPDAGIEPAAAETVGESPMYPLVFCIDQLSTFGDAGVGEDYWTNTTPTPRKARGAFLSVSQGGSLKWEGYLGDGIGAGDPGLACTPELSGGMDAVLYHLVLWSKAEVQGNEVRVVDEAIGLIRSSSVYVGASQGTYNITMAPVPDEFNVCAVGAYALYRHAGGMSGQTYSYSIGRASGSRYDRFTDTLLIKDTHHHMKFLLIHETGHAVGDYATGNQNHKLVGINCEDFSSGSCPASGGDHSMASKEFGKCALGEGFAHFYSADVFNSHNEYDCWFEYYKNEFGTDSTPLVNCEAANGDFDLRYMETNCLPAWSGYGTELDWMRALWDLHTDSGFAPGFTEIVQWLDSADVWGDEDAFDLIDLEAELLGGDLDTHWDTAKTRNGIDWPIGGYLIFADGFDSGDTSAWSSTVP